MCVTTVEDKLKLFAKIIFEKLESDSEQKVAEFTKTHDQMLEQEKKNILKESENLIKQSRKKAESKKKQIISKANIDRQHALLKKRKELFDKLLENLRAMASDYTTQPEYVSFLEKTISNSLSRIDADEVVIQFKQQDIERYGDKINGFIDKYKSKNTHVRVEQTHNEILGGCVCEDKDKTLRIDCSMASIIDENRALIGKMLMDNLQ